MSIWSKIGNFAQTTGGAASITAAGSLIGSIGSGRKAYHRSKKLMDKQFAMDKEMFDYQNKYNLPSAQMDRLKAAGLNPALMYGQGTTGNASGYPQTKFTQLNPYMNAGDIGTLANAGIQMALANAQKDNIKADTTKKVTASKVDKEEIKKINATVDNMNKDTAMKLQQTTNLKTLNDYNELKKQLEEQVVNRAKKGIIKGDTIGNILSIFGLDPVGNEDHRKWLYGALGAWYGAIVAKNIMQGVGSLIPAKKTTDIFNNYPTTTINKR